MAAGVLTGWSAGIAGLGAAILVAAMAVTEPDPPASAPKPAEVAAAETAFPDVVLPLAELPAALPAMMSPAVEPAAAIHPRAPTMTAAAATAEPARPGLPSAPRPNWPGPTAHAAQQAPPALPAPAGDIARTLAARDPTLSRYAMLPPLRALFTEVSLPAGAGPGIAEVRPVGTGPAWADAGVLSFGAPSQGIAALPSEPRERLIQSGVASWYGPGFHGRRTASGEIFNQNALTAAHPRLPFGTKVKVIDTKTGRSVIVRINDRGPYAHGRVIDLSKASAQALGVNGLTRVQLVRAD